MFAEYALQPLWRIYDGVYTAAINVGILSPEDYQNSSYQINQTNQAKASSVSDSIKIQSISPGMDSVMESMLMGPTTPANLSISLPQTTGQLQQLLNQIGSSSEINVLRGILRRYRPLSSAILDAICEHCPSPIEASSHVRKSSLSLITPSPILENLNVVKDHYYEFQQIQTAVEQCQVKGSSITENDIPTVAHVCKFVATELSNINDSDLKSASTGLTNISILLGVARVLCGTLCAQSIEYYVFGPKHQYMMESVQRIRVRLYLIMGASFIRVQEVPAGHICAVYGLEELQLKSLTLCDKKWGMPLVPYSPGLRPLVKVNIEAVSASGENIASLNRKSILE